mgnify:CR=1 FL=1
MRNKCFFRSFSSMLVGVLLLTACDAATLNAVLSGINNTTNSAGASPYYGAAASSYNSAGNSNTSWKRSVNTGLAIDNSSVNGVPAALLPAVDGSTSSSGTSSKGSSSSGRNCPNCSFVGNGKCRLCNGKGYYQPSIGSSATTKCPSCNGTGNCRSCGGTGKQ